MRKSFVSFLTVLLIVVVFAFQNKSESFIRRLKSTGMRNPKTYV
ncbi:hypothetical protein [Thermosipho atlanticus]|uniref:Uncharacterized protein n=1 Tax=Thermosipho atlanticus DSM 15807 TaxID=1123380 RepID=A0A1M5RRQ3_9BACT|nr:hypothetical protein [Thermosipho atlanticus]SHH28849.1 hypothetical protein SAMN02745199_0576 [Thermosipho atlanticus DSM 15807]